MKIIVLAAGKGERLMPLTKNTPKPLLDLGNGNTLLEEQIERIEKSHVIDEIVLVVGYLADQIEAKIKMLLSKGLQIRTIFNPFYDMSNNLISLWLAKHEMDEDFIVTNGDNLFSADVFEGLVKQNQEERVFLSIVVEESYGDDDMKVIMDNGLIVNVSKSIDVKKAHGESVGLVLVRGPKPRELFQEHLELLVRDRRYINAYWLEVFNSMHSKSIPTYPWQFDEKNKWQEIDFHMDIEKARSLLQIKIDI